MPDKRWLILGVLFLVRFVLGFQFQTVGSVAPFLVNDFGVDYAGIGLLVGLFILPGLVLSVPSGFVAQRLGDKPMVLGGLALMLAGGLVAGLAQDYDAVVAGRVISGAGAALLSVLLTKMLTDWFAGEGLFVAMAVFMIGWPVGIAAGQALQTPLALAASWQAVFLVSAVAGLVAMVAVALVYAPAPSGEGPAGEDGPARLSRRELALVTLAGIAWMFINGGYFVLVSFAPTYLVERGADVEVVAGTVSLMSWVFIVSMPLGGYLATRFGLANQLLFGGLIGTVLVGGLIPFTDWVAVSFLLFGVFFAFCGPVVAALPAQVLKVRNRGPGFGIYYIWYFLGTALLPVAAGALVDGTGTAASAVLFGAGMMLATLVLVIVFRVAQGRGESATA